MSRGFYSLQNGSLVYAPNSVIGPGFQLTEQDKGDGSTGWVWAESEEIATSYFQNVYQNLSPRQIGVVEYVKSYVPQRKRTIDILKGLVADDLQINYVLQGNSPEVAFGLAMATGKAFYAYRHTNVVGVITEGGSVSYNELISIYENSGETSLKDVIAQDDHHAWLDWKQYNDGVEVEGKVIRDRFTDSI